MSVSKSNSQDQETAPMDLSKTPQPTTEAQGTTPAVTAIPSSIVSHATVTSFQALPTYGIRVANSVATMPGSLSQALTSLISSSTSPSVQVPRNAVPLVTSGMGTNQVVYPRMTHPAFPQTIPISSALIGQQITLQRLPSKVQHLPVGTVTQISNQQIIQHRSTSPGKTISPRQTVPVNSQRPVVSNFNPVQHFQKSSAPTLVNVSQAQQIALRIPNVTGQQVTIQRAVTPLIAQQMTSSGQSNFIQCLPNAALVSQQIAQSSPNAGPLQTNQPVAGNLRATSPIGTATIVGSASQLGTATFVAAQPISIQPRPPVAYIAGTPSTGMTLTVTSISPASTALQTSSSTHLTPPSQQLVWPASSISQGQFIRTGIPVVLPRGSLNFAGKPQLIQSSSIPRLIQKPLVSLATNCGGQVTVQVPQVINPVIKTVIPTPSTILSNKDGQLIQTTNINQPSTGVIYSAVLVSTSTVTASSQAPMTTSTSATPVNQVLDVDPNQTANNSEPIMTTVIATSSTVSTTAHPEERSASTPATITESNTGIISTCKISVTSHTSEVDCTQKIPELKDATPVPMTANSQAAKLVLGHHQETPVRSLIDGASRVNVPENGCIPGELSTDDTAASRTPSLTPALACSNTITTSSCSIPVLSLNGSQIGISNEAEDPQKNYMDAETSGQVNTGGSDCMVLTEGLIDSNLLEWSDGVGKLPGTDMKFKINEFGDLELIEETGPNDEEVNSNSILENIKQTNHVTANYNVTDLCNNNKGAEHCSVSDPSELSDHEGDPICCCVYCGRYGYKSNFKTSGRFCSQNCAGKRKLQRKQVIMSRIMMGMKKQKKKLLLSGDVRDLSQEQQNGSASGVEKKLLNFDWESYLAETKSVGAPKRLFKEPFPASRNGFRPGMRLEGIDPKHQSLFCVLSVAEVQGYRLRLHFDGYSECYDFWVNADSPYIFPVGWAEKNSKVLQPPKNVPIGEFNWTNYLKQTRAVAAPKHLFLNQPSMVVPSAFRVGMKLEAVDKKNSNLVCVASVADTLGDRILIHFDGWEDTYDYWCDVTSPSIRPVGWCHDNGHTLSPPPDYDDGGNFTWNTYLHDTQSTAVPARAFKTRGPMGFEKGMRVEVTDRRNPILIRVASIADTKDYRLLIHFDGWDSIYDYWIDDDSGDLHPPNWCNKTFHPLQNPIDKKTLKYISDSGGCPTIGCNGIGHIKGAKYTGHHSAFGCPYSEVNISKDSALTDRLGSSRSEEGVSQPARFDGPADMRKCPTPGCDGLGHVTGKFTSHHCLSGCPLAEKNMAKIKQEIIPEPKPVGRPGRGRKRKLFGLSHPLTDKVIKTELVDEASEDRSVFHASIHESVFQSMASSLAMIEQPMCWEQHAKLLPGIAEVSQTVVSNWTVDEVADFVLKLTGNEEQAQKFREEQVDGDSFLLLQQSDLMNCLNIKLGPAIKIFNSILVFKAASETY